MSGKAPARTEGWYLPYFARKWHYFQHDRSLCRRWSLISNTDRGHPVSLLIFFFESPTNCKVCQRKHKTEMAAKPVSAEEQLGAV